MEGKVSKLLVVLAVCLMAFPCLIYGASSAVPAPASNSSDKAAALPQASDGDLYDNRHVSSDSSFTSGDFATPTSSSHDIRVWFDNQGNDGMKVTLYKGNKSRSKEIGSFKVDIGKNSSREFKGEKGTTYHIVIDSDYGGAVKGHLRARQLNSPDEADVTPSDQGVLYDNPGMSSKAEFDTYDFSTPSDHSHNLRVWFDNQGSETVTVVFCQSDDNSQIGAFDVAPGKNVSFDYSGKAGTSYYVKITSQYGADVKGYLRVRQL